MRELVPEAYSEHSQTSETEFFAKSGFEPLTIFCLTCLNGL